MKIPTKMHYLFILYLFFYIFYIFDWGCAIDMERKLLSTDTLLFFY